MFGFAETPRAWWLTRGMARIAGVNLSQAVVDGWLSRDELDSIVTRCGACTSTGRCDAWLSRSGGAGQLPAFCPNKAALEALGTH